MKFYCKDAPINDILGDPTFSKKHLNARFSNVIILHGAICLKRKIDFKVPLVDVLARFCFI